MPFVCFYACVPTVMYPCAMHTHVSRVGKNIDSWGFRFYFSTCIESSTAYKTLSYHLPYLISISTCEIGRPAIAPILQMKAGAWTSYTTCPDSLAQTISYKTKSKV